MERARPPAPTAAAPSPAPPAPRPRGGGRNTPRGRERGGAEGLTWLSRWWGHPATPRTGPARRAAPRVALSAGTAARSAGAPLSPAHVTGDANANGCDADADAMRDEHNA